MSGHRNEGQVLAGLLDPTEELRMNLGESEGLGSNASWGEIGRALEEKDIPDREALRIQLAQMKGLPETATWDELSG